MLDEVVYLPSWTAGLFKSRLTLSLPRVINFKFPRQARPSPRFNLSQRLQHKMPTSSWANFTTSMELGIVWPPTWLELAVVGSSWLEFDQAQILPNSSQVFYRLANSANSNQLSPSCFVIVRWLRGRSQTNEWFSCELARLGSTVWPPADARFDFVTWLELAWVGSTVWPGL